ncbi:MAG: NAD(P)-dependent oxidoreductase [Syntrophomonas sp.]
MVLARIGLTGASGMLGIHLVKLLLEKKIDIAASSIPGLNNLSPYLQCTAWDLSQWKRPEEINTIFPDVDALVHIGAITSVDASRQAIFDVNVRSCLCLSEWAMSEGVPFIYISGATVYAAPEKNNILETDSKVISGIGGFYGYSKYLGEQVLLYMAQQGLKICILRPSSIYGNGLSENKMISRFLNIAEADGVIELEHPIKDRIDLIHARDVAEAVIQVLEHESWGIFNIASECPSSIYEIAQTCVEVVGKGSVSCMPGLDDGIPSIRYGLNCDAARCAFNFSPKLTLKQGISRMWQDVKNTTNILVD